MLRRYLAGPTLIRDPARAGRFTGQPVVRRCQDGSGAVGRRASGWIWPAGLTVCPAVTTLIGRGGGTVTRVGVALSGGGHRASVWAAGLLLYLADAGRNGDVGLIASVSGGSITNGVVAQPGDHRQGRADEVRRGLGPLLHHIAYPGLFFWGPSTNLYVITVLGVLGLGLLGILAGLVNQAAIARLDAWSRTGQGVYVSYGQPLALDAVVPGVQVRVIGPPTVAQHKAVAKER